MNNFILLTCETMWKRPINAASFGIDADGNAYRRRWFSQWDTFEEAIKKIKCCHDCEIKIDRQWKILF